ncbi:MAG: hypothetical protein ABI591_31780 [Kofleriaceae bacterium]
MKHWLVVAWVVAALLVAQRAHADDTFEAKAQTAQPLHRVESLVWAMTAACDAGDDVEQRQCRRVREARQRELSNGTWLVVADADAFDVGTWNPTKKSLPITLDACIRCAGVELDGKTWYVTGVTATPPRFESGKLRTGMLHDNARAFADDATASMWGRAVAKVKVEMIVKLAAKSRWSEGGKNGLALDVIGYRVFTPCDGTVILSSPPSSPVEPDKKACPVAGEQQPTVAEAEAGPQVEQLTASIIDDAMQPVVDAAWKCYGQFAVTGKAKLKLTITAEGGIGKYEQQGDFVNTPTGACIDKAMAKSHFPRTKKTKTTILFPITIQP